MAAPSVEETVLSLLNDRDPLAKHPLTTYARVFSWALDSVPWVHMSVSVAVPCCFDDCCLVVSFEIRKHESPDFVSPSQDIFGHSRSLEIPRAF